MTIASSDSSLVTNAQLFVDTYNKLAKKIADLTFYDATQNTTGTLFGSGETLRVESGLSSLLSGRFFGVGSIQSLEAARHQLQGRRHAVARPGQAQGQVCGRPRDVDEVLHRREGRLLAQGRRARRNIGRPRQLAAGQSGEALQSRIDQNSERIDFLNAHLDRRTEYLTKQFTNMETAIGKLQNNLTSINSIQALPSLISSGSRRG